MPEMFMNGDVYIKLKPDYEIKIKISPNALDARFFAVNKITGEKKQIRPEDLPEKALENLENEGLIKREKITTYNNNGLYQIFAEGNSIKMINKETGAVLEYKDINEVKLKYINLYEFIKQSIYCGRFFISKDSSKPEYELLMTHQEYYLLRDITTGEYTVKDKHNPELNGYEILGFMPDYIEKQELYKQIMRSIFSPRQNNDDLKR